MTFQLAGDAPEIYERVMVPLWFGRWAEALVTEVDLRSGERVLDVACGTGVTTRLAKGAVGATGTVEGLDINAPMLAQAKALAGDQDINWIEGDVTAIDRPAEAYDVVMSQHGYHYFPEKRSALHEFLRLLAPGGRLAFSIWDGHSPYTDAICAAVERHISPQVAAKQRAQRETPSANELLQHVQGAGFADVVVIRQELNIDVPSAAEFVPLHLGSMPIAGAFLALPDDDKKRLTQDVEQAMHSYTQRDRIIYPDAVNVVIGYKR